MSKSVTLLRTDAEPEINNSCAIHFRLKKLTIWTMVIPPGHSGAAHVDTRRNDNSRPGNYFRKRRAAQELAWATFPRPNGRANYKESMAGGKAARKGAWL